MVVVAVAVGTVTKKSTLKITMSIPLLVLGEIRNPAIGRTISLVPTVVVNGAEGHAVEGVNVLDDKLRNQTQSMMTSVLKI